MSYAQDGLIEASDFNTFRNQVDLVYGVGNGNTGYGQTAISLPTVTGGNVELVKSVEWTALRSAMVACATHQGTSVSLPSAAQVAVDALIQAHPPASGDIPTAVTNLTTNRLNADAAAVSVFFDAITSTRATAWSVQLIHEFTVTFSSGDAARYFFNAGGQIRMRGSRSGGSGTTQNSAWTTLLNSMGSIIFDHTQTASSNAVGTGSTIGYYDLTSVYQQIYTVSSSTANYTSNDVTVFARYNDAAVPVGANGDNGLALQFQIQYNDDHTNAFSDQVSGTFTSNVDLRRATSPLTIAAPALVNVVDLTAGS